MTRRHEEETISAQTRLERSGLFNRPDLDPQTQNPLILEVHRDRIQERHPNPTGAGPEFGRDTLWRTYWERDVPYGVNIHEILLYEEQSSIAAHAMDLASSLAHPHHQLIENTSHHQYNQVLLEAAHDTLMAGRHLAYRTIRDQDPEGLAAARRVMKKAGLDFLAAMENPHFRHEELDRYRNSLWERDEEAIHYVSNLTERVCESADLHQDEVDRVIAAARTERDLARFRERMDHIPRDRHGTPRSALRNLLDNAANPLEHLAERMTSATAQQDRPAMREIVQNLDRFQDRLNATSWVMENLPEQAPWQQDQLDPGLTREILTDIQNDADPARAAREKLSQITRDIPQESTGETALTSQAMERSARMAGTLAEILQDFQGTRLERAAAQETAVELAQTAHLAALCQARLDGAVLGDLPGTSQERGNTVTRTPRSEPTGQPGNTGRTPKRERHISR